MIVTSVPSIYSTTLSALYLGVIPPPYFLHNEARAFISSSLHLLTYEIL